MTTFGWRCMPCTFMVTSQLRTGSMGVGTCGSTVRTGGGHPSFTGMSLHAARYVIVPFAATTEYVTGVPEA